MKRSRPIENNKKDVVIPADGVSLYGILEIPPQSRGVVIFAHGSGSGRFSPRNNFVAQILQDAGIATLLVDLLEESESLNRQKVFDIDLLANRLLSNAHWLRHLPDMQGLMIGYFGASTGAAAALQAAAREPIEIAAVVSRGGRPDLAMEYLHLVQAPTLLIVGGNDKPVIPLNETAFARLTCPKELVIVPGSTHLFEEPGALDKVAQLARDWFIKYFIPKV
ncbi:MAG: dienelactone hydrolase family protein [Planctomycetes bacterium]|uniref:dienelactone hydrolase family protein n=1 Tax=Candidatus Wunengus californicus TaxID=3367619 RepID=UPI00402809B6|nr:dienelactone hydrolase family protein [Planctomycetota bacterium]MBI4221235.1 dienelactone hydrolase family protein [Planctomycetota bacterium]